MLSQRLVWVGMVRLRAIEYVAASVLLWCWSVLWCSCWCGAVVLMARVGVCSAAASWCGGRSALWLAVQSGLVCCVRRGACFDAGCRSVC